MFSSKTVFSHSLRTYQKASITPSELARNANDLPSPKSLKCWLISLAIQRPISISAQSETSPSPNGKFNGKSKIPLDVMFKEALGLCERREINESEMEEVNIGNIAELKKNLWDLEMELRQLKAKSGEQGKNLDSKFEGATKSNPKTRSLVTLFVNENGEREKFCYDREKVVLKEISGDMQVLLRHLYGRGYFKCANFLPENKFDISYFDGRYARDFLKSALESFGKDNQEICKWLSGSDLKAIASFGCPSNVKRDVFAAKRWRTFFKIPEETVCCKCSLKESCKFQNQRVWDGDTKNLRLDLLMRLLRTYSAEDIPTQLKVPDNVKDSVSRLIHEIINLTKSLVE